MFKTIIGVAVLAAAGATVPVQLAAVSSTPAPKTIEAVSVRSIDQPEARTVAEQRASYQIRHRRWLARRAAWLRHERQLKARHEAWLRHVAAVKTAERAAAARKAAATVEHTVVHAQQAHVATSSAGITSVWQALVACEAGGDWQYGGPNGHTDPGYNFEGGPNFTNSTWLANGGGQFAQHAYDASPAEQITVARQVLASQGVMAWPVCGPRVGLQRGD